MPETNQPTEVVDGVVVIMPGPTFLHQMIAGNLYLLIRGFVQQHDLGLAFGNPIDLIIRKLPKLRVRQPDLSFFSNARAGFLATSDPNRLFAEAIAPSLVVEILSPGQNETTLAEKLADYASIAVDEVWFVDQVGRSIRVLARDGGAYRLAGDFSSQDRLISAVLPGLDLDVAATFGTA